MELCCPRNHWTPACPREVLHTWLLLHLLNSFCLNPQVFSVLPSRSLTCPTTGISEWLYGADLLTGVKTQQLPWVEITKKCIRDEIVLKFKYCVAMHYWYPNMSQYLCASVRSIEPDLVASLRAVRTLKTRFGYIRQEVKSHHNFSFLNPFSWDHTAEYFTSNHLLLLLGS